MLFRLDGRAALAFAAVPLLAVPYFEDAERHRPVAAGQSSATEAAQPSPMKSDKPKRKRPGWIWNIFGFGDLPGECTSWLRAGDVAPTMTVRRFDEVSLCFKGFTSNDAPRLQVFGPDGKPTQKPRKATLPVGAGLQWFWYREEAGEAFNRPGVFRFTVTAAHTAGTSGSIVVKPATKSGVYFSFDDPIRPGEAVTGTAVGRQPKSLVLASLYGDEFGDERHAKLRLLEDLAPVPVDDNGEAVVRWVASKDLKSGTHVVLVEPIAPGENECDLSCAVFEVENRG
jgi:hypothetical protein